MNIAKPDELKEYLERFPKTDTLELLIPDLNGYLRGKRIDRSAFEKVFKEGIYLPLSVFGLDATGTTVEETGLGFETGDGDGVCRPLAGTLAPVPWKTNCAQVLLTMNNKEDQDFEGNPRLALERIVSQIHAEKLKAVVAVELEFYLAEYKKGRLKPAKSLSNGQRSDSTQVYSMADLDDFKPFIDLVMEYSAAQNLPADAVIAEYAPGQFEVNLHHVDNPVLAADQAILLKRVIIQAAQELGMRATFMAKPYIDQAGSGTHIHCSMFDTDGKNIFLNQPETLEYAVAGLLNTLLPAQVLMFPTMNSYKRLGEETFAPHARTWGWDNRTVAVRIPGGSDKARRIEHRVAGADANPYLTVALVLAGMHYGLQQKKQPVKPYTGNAYEQIAMELTDSARVAVDRFLKNDALSSYFNEEFIKILIAVRQADINLFNQQITELELKYLL